MSFAGKDSLVPLQRCRFSCTGARGEILVYLRATFLGTDTDSLVPGEGGLACTSQVLRLACRRSNGPRLA
eukprot:1999900-Rhodomonas_salina.1